MPARKWSTVLVVRSIGIRTGAVHVMPSVDVLITMSFSAHPLRNRQSYQVTYALPDASDVADTMSSVRIPPAGVCTCWVATVFGPVKVAPPSVETNDQTWNSGFESIGTITRPFGRAIGLP